MSAKLHIREARRQDSRELARVHIETWRHTYAGMVPNQYLASMTIDEQARSWRRWIDRKSKRESIQLVETRPAADAMEKSRIVGFGHAGPSRDRELPFSGEIYTLYVDIDWQGMGIGRQLLGRLFQALLEADMESAVIWVLASNPSRFFYEALGGERIAERRERFAGTLLEEVAYGWPDSSALRALTPDI
ncbi:GNAT family N-acetyltransferase [Pelagibius sp. Alg239-R121]|uniref:GNAT family N-acetyltransferase n=1 Tax=Pelagibius sp. Alg239-R121 TaxID=2993448 RepID=UPI0024A6F9CC|nr:GNAT family N-acetyltransferase [Pelagibius sp. Alg239-R121]